MVDHGKPGDTGTRRKSNGDAAEATATRRAGIRPVLSEKARELLYPNVKPQYGEKRISFKATAFGVTGAAINNGQLYGNCDHSPVELQVWAATLFRSTSYRVAYVEIIGREMQFRGNGWHSTGKHYSHHRAERDLPLPLSPADQDMRCYHADGGDDADAPEVMHQRRSDGSCQCGAHTSRFPVAAPTVDDTKVAAALQRYAEVHAIGDVEIAHTVSDDDLETAIAAYRRQRGLLTIPEQAELSKRILDYLAGRR